MIKWLLNVHVHLYGLIASVEYSPYFLFRLFSLSVCIHGNERRKKMG